MAKLTRVTITGADNSTPVDELVQLSNEYPFVEWGILISASNVNTPRYPSPRWMATLAAALKNADARSVPKVSIHVQGHWLRSLMLGDKEELVSGGGKLLQFAQRVQFNFHGGTVIWNETPFLMELASFPLTRGPKQFIFQVDGNQGAAILKRIRDYCHGLDLVPFYDTSHGAGVLPELWPKADPNLLALKPDLRVGYAGGLGPDNLAEQIPLIADAAGDNNFWIDMETKVRTPEFREDDFDLDKVVKALKICKKFVE